MTGHIPHMKEQNTLSSSQYSMLLLKKKKMGNSMQSRSGKDPSYAEVK